VNIEIEKNEKIYTNVKNALDALKYPNSFQNAILCKNDYEYVGFIFEITSSQLQRSFMYIDNNSNDIEVDYYDSIVNDYIFDNITFEIIKRDDIKIIFKRGN